MTYVISDELSQALTEISRDVFLGNVERGWYSDPKTGERIDRNIPEMLCLIHSEVSEGLEGFRKGLMDDKLPEREMLEVELADVLIRVFDLAGYLHFDLGGAVKEKMEFNAVRKDHNLKERSEGGKKF